MDGLPLGRAEESSTVTPHSLVHHNSLLEAQLEQVTEELKATVERKTALETGLMRAQQESCDLFHRLNEVLEEKSGLEERLISARRQTNALQSSMKGLAELLQTLSSQPTTSKRLPAPALAAASFATLVPTVELVGTIVWQKVLGPIWSSSQGCLLLLMQAIWLDALVAQLITPLLYAKKLLMAHVNEGLGDGDEPSQGISVAEALATVSHIKSGLDQLSHCLSDEEDEADPQPHASYQAATVAECREALPLSPIEYCAHSVISAQSSTIG